MQSTHTLLSALTLQGLHRWQYSPWLYLLLPH